MDRKGFEIIRDAAAPESVAPEPTESENLEFVTIDTVAGSPAALLERLGKAGLLSDSAHASLAEGPVLDACVSNERCITFIDRNARERPEHNFSHLEEEDLQLVRGIEEAENNPSIVSSLHKAGLTQDTLAQITNFSRNTIKAYISRSRNQDGAKPMEKRSSLMLRGVRNAFLGLVGREGFSLDKATFTLTHFYMVGAKRSLEDPFELDEDIKNMIERMYE